MRILASLSAPLIIAGGVLAAAGPASADDFTSTCYYTDSACQSAAKAKCPDTYKIVLRNDGSNLEDWFCVRL
ncbi:hypothetical protein ACFVMC_09245 [Nocardia sp. NPDC127579]|uniref:hypothetical protein n=1 Tax=Nocardia sp. NPDC127579 TaxID=3345402 RepID=UPI00362898C9